MPRRLQKLPDKRGEKKVRSCNHEIHDAHERARMRCDGVDKEAKRNAWNLFFVNWGDTTVSTIAF